MLFVIIYKLIYSSLKSRAQLHVQRFQPLRKENREVFFSTKGTHMSAQASRGVWRYVPPMKFCKFSFSQVAFSAFCGIL